MLFEKAGLSPLAVERQPKGPLSTLKHWEDILEEACRAPPSPEIKLGSRSAPGGQRPSPAKRRALAIAPTLQAMAEEGGLSGLRTCITQLTARSGFSVTLERQR